jgi:hypothetical protein
MVRSEARKNERGTALVVVLLILVGVAALIAGAAAIGANTGAINKYHDRLSVLETAADAGLDEARSAVNANKTVYPDTGYRTLESGGAVYAADGTVIPNVRRWLYVGPSGVTSGQYGMFGSAVSVVEDAQGNRVVRRGDIYQESFAKYAYFTTIEGTIQFAANDQLFGPVHSNDVINIATGSPGATFWGPVSTAQTINNRSSGNYKQGYKEHVAVIPMPTTADLTKLQAQAAIGGTSIVGDLLGNAGEATTRIEFLALDLNGDGDSTDANEGFMKVYRAPSANAWWVVAHTNNYAGTGATNGVRNSPNCGHAVIGGTGNHGPEFVTFFNHNTAWVGTDSKSNAPTMVGQPVERRCYLGGSDILNADAANPKGKFVANDGRGSWQLWPGAVSALLAGRSDASYLWPINRELNPNFKGVIHVAGKVVVSGRVRGAVTLAATSDIIIADDVTYMTNPGAPGRNCRDMLGLFSATDVIVSDNLINDPIPPLQGLANVTWDESKDEFVHAVVLALDNFTVENYNSGPTNFEKCESTNWGRGCLYLTGGIIQKQRGAVGTTSGTGNLKRYSYDACGSESPPPYFPTTGRFSRGHYYEVEPTGFDITDYWQLLVAGK